MTPRDQRTFLRRLGLDRSKLRAWATYDLTNSAFVTTVVAVFPIYFSSLAAADLPPTTATALAIVAVLGPFLGALADFAPMKKKLLAAFLILGVGAAGGMFFVHRGDWVLGAALFMLANIGIAGTFIFYDALVSQVARPDEIDRVSSAGYALGYLGAGVLLPVNPVSPGVRHGGFRYRQPLGVSERGGVVVAVFGGAVSPAAS